MNFGDFQRVFGGLNPDSDTSFQVSQFFLNGGTEAWVSRLYATSVTPVQPSTALPCATQLPPGGSSGGGGAATLAPPGKGTTPWTLTSQNPGTWGSNIFVTIDYMTNRLNTFNLTATLYSTSSNSNSSSTSHSVVQTQSVPGVTFDATQSNVITNVMQASNPNSQLLAIPGVPTLAPPCVPCASGTILSFVAPPAEVPGVEFTVTVQPPTPPGSKPVPPLPPAPLTSTFSISSLTDLIVGIQSALSNAAGPLQLPSLGSTLVRSCFSPFPAPAPAQGKPPAGPTQLVQIWSPDPSLAGYLIGVTCNNTSLFTTLTTNYQAQQLTYTTDNDKQKKSPDGLPPTGFDVAGNSTNRTGIYALDEMQIVNLILVPDMTGMGTSDYLTGATATLNYAIQRKAFAILDMPAGIASPSAAVSWATSAPATFGTGIISAATYFPQVLVPSPFSSQPQKIGASGTLAGIYAYTDQSRGVWKAPAGITAPLAGVEQLSYVMNDPENGQINPLGINALRTFPIYDNISWGARTLAAGNIADEDWKYISVRRLALYIEQSLSQGLQWVVFEPNDDRLWAQIRLSVNGFLHPLYLQGAFVGASTSQAYQCICDASTTTAEDMENGIVNILILFAPVRPAEFVVISLQQMAGQSSS
ncbi:MAG TPA: phage tail sheath C-terminal domain-containing protein [Bradyrhizobium sp.]|nr:phage tail sheath C-terminal domain-containing protein [Bradyrhizobium sp.]